MLVRPTQRIAIFLMTLCIQQSAAETMQPESAYSDKECIHCHSERDPNLVQQWRLSAHAESPTSGCSGCHGKQHRITTITMSMRARQDKTCIDCHQGAAAHSYTTSKHGVLNTIETEQQKRSAPLKAGNYRSPGCSYCHYHNGNHNDTMQAARGSSVRQKICSGCHSPRYIRELFANAVRQLEIADLKLAEGEALITSLSARQQQQFNPLRAQLQQHRKNVLLGVGHQSPDYQWWHGQPALDGDLIRIRDAIQYPHTLQ